jgi:hypothetical protein
MNIIYVIYYIMSAIKYAGFGASTSGAEMETGWRLRESCICWRGMAAHPSGQPWKWCGITEADGRKAWGKIEEVGA